MFLGVIYSFEVMYTSGHLLCPIAPNIVAQIIGNHDDTFKKFDDVKSEDAGEPVRTNLNLQCA